MSMKKIIKTIYKLELTEETYKKVVELMKSTGDMEKELKEFGVINSVNIDDFIKNYIKERNTPTPYTPFDEKKKTFSYERNPKLEQDIILRSMFSTSAVPQELINNGFPLAMIPYESVDEEPEIKYSNPFKLNNFKLVSGKSKKGDKFGAISIYQYDEEGEVTANINLNHYNAIQLVKVLENIIEDVNSIGTSMTSRVARFSIDNKGLVLPLNEDNDNIVSIFFNIIKNSITINKKENNIVLTVIEAQELVNFIKQYKEMK